MNKYQKVMEHVKVDDEMKNRILQNIENEMKDAKANGSAGAQSAGKAYEQPGNAGIDGSGQSGDDKKIRPFSSRFGAGLRRYGGLAAMFAVLLVAAAAVIQITGDVKNTSSTVSYDSAPASGMMESESAAEAPASAESPTYEADFAAESPMAEAEYAEDSAMADAEYEAEEYASAETAETAEYDGAVMEETPVLEAESAAEEPVSAEKAEDAMNADKTDNLAGLSPAESDIAPQPSTAKVLFAVLLPILLLAAIILVLVLVIKKIRKRK